MLYRLRLGMRRCNNETVLIRISKISDKLLRTSLWMIEVQTEMMPDGAQLQGGEAAA